MKRNRHVFPVHEIRTDGMRPVHVSPNRSAGIVLEEHMVLAPKEARCAGIVLPVSLGQQMELRPEGIVHELFPSAVGSAA